MLLFKNRYEGGHKAVDTTSELAQFPAVAWTMKRSRLLNLHKVLNKSIGCCICAKGSRPFPARLVKFFFRNMFLWWGPIGSASKIGYSDIGAKPLATGKMFSSHSQKLIVLESGEASSKFDFQEGNNISRGLILATFLLFWPSFEGLCTTSNQISSMGAMLLWLYVQQANVYK